MRPEDLELLKSAKEILGLAKYLFSFMYSIGGCIVMIAIFVYKVIDRQKAANKRIAQLELESKQRQQEQASISLELAVMKTISENMGKVQERFENALTRLENKL